MSFHVFKSERLFFIRESYKSLRILNNITYIKIILAWLMWVSKRQRNASY